jgi:hypothetical protein
MPSRARGPLGGQLRSSFKAVVAQEILRFRRSMCGCTLNGIFALDTRR